MSENLTTLFSNEMKEALDSVLSMLLGKEMNVKPETAEEVTKDFLLNRLLNEKEVILAAANQNESSGKVYLLYPLAVGGLIANLMMGVEEGKEEISAEDLDALTEASNQVLSSFALGIKEKTSLSFSLGQASLAKLPLQEIYERIDGDEILFSSIETSLAPSPSPLYLVISSEVRERLLQPAEEAHPSAAPSPSAPSVSAPPSGAFRTTPPSLEGYPHVDSKIDMLMDIELPIVIRVGTTEMPLKNVLKIGLGSIIQLNKTVDDPIDLLVNGKLVARGEVVVVDSNFALRITEIVSREERIKFLGG